MKSRSIFSIMAALALNLVGACSHSIHELYIGSMDDNVHYGQGRWITADTEDFVILWFAFNTDYVNKAYRDLADKCEGRIAQVTTESLTSYRFLSFNQKLVLRGLCI